MTDSTRGLLGIDVASEIRKLAVGSLDGPWQVPAELVRHSFARGARRVEVEIGQRTVVVRDDGAGLSPCFFDILARLLDETVAAADRHRPLLEVEATAAPLLGLLALTPAQLRLESRGAQGGRRLTVRRGRAPEQQALPPGRGVRLELSGVRLHPRRARDWLRAVGRFAPAPLWLDGQLLGSGFGATLAEAALGPPLAGRLALPRGAEAGRVFLLQDGLVSAHLVLPQAPAFAAAVEMRPLLGSDGSPGALREAIRPHLSRLVEQGTRLALEAVGALPRLAVADRHQLQRLLLTAAERRVRGPEVLRAAAWPVLDQGIGAGERWLSLRELGPLAGRQRNLWALAPEQDPACFLLPAGPVLVADTDLRGRLSRLLGLAFKTPQRRPETGRWKERWRQAAASAVAALTRLRRARPRLPESILSPNERGLLRALQAQLAGCGQSPLVAFCAGRGTAGRDREGWLLLPRGNPAVALAARAVASDRFLIEPALLALDAGRS